MSFNIQQIRAGIGHEVDVELEIKCLREYMIRRLSNWLGQAFLRMNLKIMGNIIYMLDMELFFDCIIVLSFESNNQDMTQTNHWMNMQ